MKQLAFLCLDYKTLQRATKRETKQKDQKILVFVSKYKKNIINYKKKPQL